jgi:hypothetical protein
MNEFLIELDKFYQTYKSKTEFELGFQKQKQKVQILKFILKFIEFEPNSKLNWISFELIQRKKEKSHYSLGPHRSPQLHCSQGQAQLGRPTTAETRSF